ncbi:MAG: peptidase, partial [Oscillospiraceae bacterium]|nr:peptidase [Oscillospiraceae bacterium]
EPASAFFKGETEFSTAEARILRDYTLRYDFDVTISYHSSGSIIYWQYGDKQPVNDLSHQLGEAVNAVTGYPLIGSDSVDGAGYKDWVMNSLEIPSLTVEIGSEDSPLSERELYSVFARNYMVLPAIAGWLQN